MLGVMGSVGGPTLVTIRAWFPELDFWMSADRIPFVFQRYPPATHSFHSYSNGLIVWLDSSYFSVSAYFLHSSKSCHRVCIGFIAVRNRMGNVWYLYVDQASNWLYHVCSVFSDRICCLVIYDARLNGGGWQLGIIRKYDVRKCTNLFWKHKFLLKRNLRLLFICFSSLLCWGAEMMFIFFCRRKMMR